MLQTKAKQNKTIGYPLQVPFTAPGVQLIVPLAKAFDQIPGAGSLSSWLPRVLGSWPWEGTTQ